MLEHYFIIRPLNQKSPKKKKNQFVTYPSTQLLAKIAGYELKPLTDYRLFADKGSGRALRSVIVYHHLLHYLLQLAYTGKALNVDYYVSRKCDEINVIDYSHVY